MLQMNVADYFRHGRRRWVRLHERAARSTKRPAFPKPELFLDAHIEAAGLAADVGGALFRTTGRTTGVQHRMTPIG
ncbi:MAG: hypothetical protein WA324_00410 [Bryobacteraceae bacterium]